MTRLTELIEEIDRQLDTDDDWMPQVGVQSMQISLQESDPARLHEIVSTLRADPMLIEPCLNWIQSKIYEINSAKINALYSEDEIRELQERYLSTEEDGQ